MIVGGALEVAGRELGTLLIEGAPVFLRRPERLSLRQQVVAREPRLDVDHVAHLAQVFDPF